MTTARTLDETKTNIRKAIRGHLETLRQFGDPIPNRPAWLVKWRCFQPSDSIRRIKSRTFTDIQFTADHEDWSCEVAMSVVNRDPRKIPRTRSEPTPPPSWPAGFTRRRIWISRSAHHPHLRRVRPGRTAYGPRQLRRVDAAAAKPSAYVASPTFAPALAERCSRWRAPVCRACITREAARRSPGTNTRG